MKYSELDIFKSKNKSLKVGVTKKKNDTNDNKVKIGQLVRESMENISKPIKTEWEKGIGGILYGKSYYK
ncbi:MAG: hypothetical protein KZY56_02030 [Clostridiaceae bacterium]|nr:hypothetical protein [Clostridiaceae bacterium]